MSIMVVLTSLWLMINQTTKDVISFLKTSSLVIKREKKLKRRKTLVSIWPKWPSVVYNFMNCLEWHTTDSFLTTDNANDLHWSPHIFNCKSLSIKSFLAKHTYLYVHVYIYTHTHLYMCVFINIYRHKLYTCATM